MRLQTTQGQKFRTSYIKDPGDAHAIPLKVHDGIVHMAAGAGEESNTLGRPRYVGQRVALLLVSTGGGSRVVIVTGGYNQTGNDVYTFAAEGDFCALVGVRRSGGLAWQEVANDGASRG